MTWRDKLVARILLMVAQLVCEDPGFRRELQNLSNHIGIHSPAAEVGP